MRWGPTELRPDHDPEVDALPALDSMTDRERRAIMKPLVGKPGASDLSPGALQRLLNAHRERREMKRANRMRAMLTVPVLRRMVVRHQAEQAREEVNPEALRCAGCGAKRGRPCDGASTLPAGVRGWCPERVRARDALVTVERCGCGEGYVRAPGHVEGACVFCLADRRERAREKREGKA